MTSQQLIQARADHWHHNAAPILTLEDASLWVQTTGFLLFLPRRQQLPAPAPSFVEACMGAFEHTPARAAIENAFELAKRLFAPGEVIPLNLLGTLSEEPDFLVTRERLPLILSLRGDRSWKTAPGGRTSPLNIGVWKLLDEQDELTVGELRSGLGREVTDAAVRRALIDLWGTMRVYPRYEGGETVWALVKAAFPKECTKAATTAQGTALALLAADYLRSAIAASEDEITSFLSPLASRSKVREVIHALTATRQLDSISLGPNTLYHIAGELPEFPEAETLGAEASVEGATSADGTKPADDAAASAPASERIRKYTPRTDRNEPTGGRGAGFSRPDRSARPPRSSREERPARSDEGFRPTARNYGKREGGPGYGRDNDRRPSRSEGGFKPRGEGGYKPRTEGGFKPRGEGSYKPRTEGGFKPRGEGSYKPRTEGGFKPRGEGSYKPRTEGGFKPRGEGSYKPRTEGGFKPRGEGSYKPRTEGGFKPRGEGSYKPRTEGGFKPRDEGSYKPRTEGGYKPRGEGSYKPRTEGGFKPRGEGGFKSRTEGGYKPRGEGGYKPRGEGGFRPPFRKDRDASSDQERPARAPRPSGTDNPGPSFRDRSSSGERGRKPFGGSRGSSGPARKPYGTRSGSGFSPRKRDDRAGAGRFAGPRDRSEAPAQDRENRPRKPFSSAPGRPASKGFGKGPGKSFGSGPRKSFGGPKKSFGKGPSRPKRRPDEERS